MAATNAQRSSPGTSLPTHVGGYQGHAAGDRQHALADAPPRPFLRTVLMQMPVQARRFVVVVCMVVIVGLGAVCRSGFAVGRRHVVTQALEAGLERRRGQHLTCGAPSGACRRGHRNVLDPRHTAHSRVHLGGTRPQSMPVTR